MFEVLAAGTYAVRNAVRSEIERVLRGPADRAAEAWLRSRVTRLPISRWTLSPSALMWLLQEFERRKPTSIVEFGSGVSTIALSAFAHQTDGVAVVSYEHSRDWLTHTRAILDVRGLGGHTTLVHAPIGETDGWYDEAVVTATLPDSIDIVLIDGPPAYRWHERWSRGKALDVVWPRLRAGSMIAMDDLTRKGEREIVAFWGKRFGVRFDKVTRDRGFGVAITPSGTPSFF